MGLNRRIIQVLDHTRDLGVSFDRTLMIGRQQVHLNETEFRETLATCRFIQETAAPDAAIERLATETYNPQNDKYAEHLLRQMGASVTDSMDASDYEDATIVSDMNKPVSEDLHQKYSLVLDGGSLEHIFHFPTAIKSCMEMIEVGGHFFSINGANNFCGHGFYQFSPELMYRILSPENGFEVTEMLMWERFAGSTIYHVNDPAEVRGRVMPHTCNETFITVIAKRTHVAEIFAQSPQQSDYSVDWNNGEHRAPTVKAEDKPAIIQFGRSMEKKFRFVKRRLFSKYRSEHFSPVQLNRSA